MMQSLCAKSRLSKEGSFRNNAQEWIHPIESIDMRIFHENIIKKPKNISTTIRKS